MSEQKYTPDDPRLTAYVLGELDEGEKADLEKQMAQSPPLRAAVEELRGTVETVTYALRSEPAGALSPSQRSAITNAATAPLAVRKSRVESRGSRAGASGTFAVLASTMAVAVAIAVLILPPLQNGRDDRSDAGRPETAATATPSSSPMSQLLSESSSESAPSDWGFASRPSHQPADGEPAQDESETLSQKVTRLETLHERKGELARFQDQPTRALNEQQRDPEQQVDGLRQRHAMLERELPPLQTPSIALTTGGRKTAPTGRITGVVPGRVQSGPGQRSRTVRTEYDDYNAIRIARPDDDGQFATTESIILGQEVRQRPGSSETNWTNLTQRRKKWASVAAVEKAAESADSVVGADRDNSNQLANGIVADLEAPGTEQYEPIVENPFVSPLAEPLSTFSIDVDTASYSNVRRFLAHNQLPPPNAVRIEELVNYFRYDYPEPPDGEAFSVNLETGPCPWNSGHRLVRVGLKGKEIDKSQRPPSNLVFLLDVSGSMRDSNKLPLVKQAMEMLVGEMTEDDRIAIVTYSGNAGLYLDSTSGQDKTTIIDAIHALNAGGSTNGEAGIKLAYQKAVAHFINDGTNRVILCTDGDFNVGTSDDDELVKLIQEKAESDVFLSIFGFGMGNLKDAKLEKLADKGNGHYAYVDDRREARKVFVEEMAGTLYTIAKDVKIQIEFNPAQVGAYRLIGYENRMMAAQDFNDDTKDAGEVGAGHTVTALYEIIPPVQFRVRGNVDPLKYQPDPTSQPEKSPQRKQGPNDADVSKELLTFKLRYKQPNADRSTNIEFPLVDDKPRTEMPSRDFEWAASVAGFGMILRNSDHRGQADFDLIEELARGAVGDDPNGYRKEFLKLIDKAESLRP